MPVRMQYVSLEVKLVGVILLAPIIVANLLQDLARPADDTEIPASGSEWNVLQRIPGILPERSVLQKAPVFVFAQKSVGANRLCLRVNRHHQRERGINGPHPSLLLRDAGM